MNAAHAYARTQNQTASKERLMVLLFEKALASMRSGISALEQGRAVEATQALSWANEIVAELSATLDGRQAPDLAENLKSLYLFVCTRLLRAMTATDLAAAREAERVFAPLAQAFGEAVVAVNGARSTP